MKILLKGLLFKGEIMIYDYEYWVSLLEVLGGSIGIPLDKSGLMVNLLASKQFVQNHFG